MHTNIGDEKTRTKHDPQNGTHADDWSLLPVSPPVFAQRCTRYRGETAQTGMLSVTRGSTSLEVDSYRDLSRNLVLGLSFISRASPPRGLIRVTAPCSYYAGCIKPSSGIDVGYSGRKSAVHLLYLLSTVCRSHILINSVIKVAVPGVFFLL